MKLQLNFRFSFEFESFRVFSTLFPPRKEVLLVTFVWNNIRRYLISRNCWPFVASQFYSRVINVDKFIFGGGPLRRTLLIWQEQATFMYLSQERAIKSLEFQEENFLEYFFKSTELSPFLVYMHVLMN